MGNFSSTPSRTLLHQIPTCIISVVSEWQFGGEHAFLLSIMGRNFKLRLRPQRFARFADASVNTKRMLIVSII